MAHTISTGISVTNTVYNTINVGGTLNWTTGAKWTVSYTINSISPALPAANIYALSLRGLNASGSWQWTVTNISNPGGITGSAGTGFSNVNFSSITSNLPTGTYSYDVEMINTNSYVSFEFFLDSQNCVNVNSAGTDASLTLANSGNIYP